jgi:ribonuclease D
MHKIAPSKTETSLLPPFVGLPLSRIVVPKTAGQFANALAEIQDSAFVGFDTESRPTFTKGRMSEGPHVVQFSTLNRAFIFQLYRSEGHQALTEILESRAIVKVGFGLNVDQGQIRQQLGMKLKYVLDLDRIFCKDGYCHTLGVRAAIALVLNQKFHKSRRVTVSNWSLPELTSTQLLYAANDAYSALRVLLALESQRPGGILPIAELAYRHGRPQTKPPAFGLSSYN